MTVPQVKSFLHRARTRYGELLKDEVADTVSEPAQADAELADLLGAL